LRCRRFQGPVQKQAKLVHKAPHLPWALLVLQLVRVQQQPRRSHQVHLPVHQQRQLQHQQTAVRTLAVERSLPWAGRASATAAATTSTTVAQTIGQPARSHSMEIAPGRVGPVEAAPAAPHLCPHHHQHVRQSQQRQASADSHGSWPGQASLSLSSACARHHWFPTQTAVVTTALKQKHPRG